MNISINFLSPSMPHGRVVMAAAVPRKGDHVRIGDDVYVVRDVLWDMDAIAATRVDVILEKAA